MIVLLLDQLRYHLLYHWLVGLCPDDPIRHPTTFTKTANGDSMTRS